MQRSDAELVEAACRGDQASFGLLYERHYRLAVGIARGRMSDFHLAEDAAQEAFAIACRTLATLRDPRRFPEWLGTICRRTASRLDADRVRPPAVARRPRIADDPDLRALRLQVQDALPAPGGDLARDRRSSLLQRAVVQGDRPGAGPVGPGRPRAATAGAEQAGRAPRRTRFIRDQVMNSSLHEEGWEARLRAGLGECPRPDFEAWHARNADAFVRPRAVTLHADRSPTGEWSCND